MRRWFWISVSVFVAFSAVVEENIRLAVTSSNLTHILSTLAAVSPSNTDYEALYAHATDIYSNDIAAASALSGYEEKCQAFARLIAATPLTQIHTFAPYLYTSYLQLANAQFRLALAGEVSWADVTSSYSSVSSFQPLSTYDTYHYTMAKYNAHFATLQEPPASNFSAPHAGHYILRFHIPQKYQTPSLGHFGHVMLDALYGVAVAFADGVWSSSISSNPNIYVLDIGLYLIPSLRALFPHVNFIPFNTIEEISNAFAEPIDIFGIGMPSFNTTTNPFINHTYHSSACSSRCTTANTTAIIRSVFYSQLQVTPEPKCLLLISRSEDASHLRQFAAKAELDRSKEAPFLVRYHDTGKHVYTAMHYYSSTAQQRRTITNEDEVFTALYKAFKHEYKCIKKVTLSALSFAEQLSLFASAAVVIGQHGAGMAWTGFMPTNTLVIELEPLINPVFYYASEAAGVNHILLSRFEHSELYTNEKGRTSISINAEVLTEIVKKLLHIYPTPLPTAIKISKPSPTSVPTATHPAEPETAYVASMIRSNKVPVFWQDSGMASNKWATYSRKEWHAELRRRIYSQGIKLPMKIMASPTNIYNFYDSHTYHVVNINDTMQYTYFNHSLVNIPEFVPLYRQVSGVDEQQDIGFYMLEDSDMFRSQPVIAAGEHYYLRITQLPGSPLFDIIMKEGPCAALKSMNISRMSIFFSSEEAVTNLHYDESSMGGVLCQFRGRKRVLLWSPGIEGMNAYPKTHPYSRRSRYNGRNPHEVSHELAIKKSHEYILHPGDCVYIPMLWWHYVASLDEDTISIRYQIVKVR